MDPKKKVDGSSAEFKARSTVNGAQSEKGWDLRSAYCRMIVTWRRASESVKWLGDRRLIPSSRLEQHPGKATDLTGSSKMVETKSLSVNLAKVCLNIYEFNFPFIYFLHSLILNI